MRLLGYVVLVFVVIASLLQLAYFWPLLPQKVASHFGTGGKPNGYMSRDAFIQFLFIMQIGLPLFFVGIGKILRYVPNELINVPNRQVWLSPQYRTFTLRFFEGMLVWIAALMSVFFIGISYLTFEANIRDAPLDESTFLLLLGLFMGAIVGICVFTFWRFRLPRTSELESNEN